MIRSITRPKPEEEIDRLLEGLGRVFIIGCGTCTTLTQTGGAEGEGDAKRLDRQGKDGDGRRGPAGRLRQSDL